MERFPSDLDKGEATVGVVVTDVREKERAERRGEETDRGGRQRVGRQKVEV